MTDYEALKSIIEERKIRLQSFAEAIGISTQAMYNKFKNNAEWTGSQIEKARIFLNLSQNDVNRIFFAHSVEK